MLVSVLARSREITSMSAISSNAWHIAHQNIAAQQDAVDITRDRFQSGLASELDAKEADVLLATTQSQVPVFEQSLKQAVHRLGVLIGQQRARCSMNSVPPRRSPRRHPKCRSVCRRICCVGGPDVRRAQRQLVAATANIGVQTAELFPKFSLTGVAGSKVSPPATGLTAPASTGPRGRR